MRSIVVATALAAVGLVAPQAASAALVTYYFSGQTQQFHANGLEAPPTTFSGSFTFDSERPTSTYTNEFTDTVDYVPISGSLTAYGSTGQVTPNSQPGSGLQVLLRVTNSKNPQFNDSVYFEASYYVDVVSASAGLETASFTNTRYGPSSTLSSAALPLSLDPLPFSAGSAYVVSRDGSKNQSFQYTQVSLTTVAPSVPEPATWAMLLIGFGMIGASSRYRRRSTVTTFA